MKKVICVIGIICAVAGFAMLLSANLEISSNSRYTWSRPYTSYETKVIMMKYLGIFLLISGIIDVILTVISTAYTSRTIQDNKGNPSEFIVCPQCHCKTMKAIELCPNCNYRFIKKQ